MSRPKPLDAPVMRIVLLVFFIIGPFRIAPPRPFPPRNDGYLICKSSHLFPLFLFVRFCDSDFALPSMPRARRPEMSDNGKCPGRYARTNRARNRLTHHRFQRSVLCLLGDLLTCSRPLHQSSKTKRSTFSVWSEQPGRNAMPCACFSSAGWCNGSDEAP